MKILKEFEHLNEGNSRSILPDLVYLSNNSIMTNEISRILADKLDDTEFRKLQEWLRLAKSQTNIKVQQASKKFR